MPLETYDESISVLRRSLDSVKVGDSDKIDGVKRLDRFVHAAERRFSPSAAFDAAIAHEYAISGSLGGRSVFDDRPKKRPKMPAQLGLFGD